MLPLVGDVDGTSRGSNNHCFINGILHWFFSLYKALDLKNPEMYSTQFLRFPLRLTGCILHTVASSRASFSNPIMHFYNTSVPVVRPLYNWMSPETNDPICLRLDLFDLSTANILMNSHEMSRFIVWRRTKVVKGTTPKLEYRIEIATGKSPSNWAVEREMLISVCSLLAYIHTRDSGHATFPLTECAQLHRIIPYSCPCSR